MFSSLKRMKWLFALLMNESVLLNHLLIKGSLPLIIYILHIGISPLKAEDADRSTIQQLSIDRAIKVAQQNDPWLVGNRYLQDAVEAQSIYASSLPDPKISLGLANLPIDSLNFGQEAMTQTTVGISQMFPAGDSLNIRKRQLELQSAQFPFERQDRMARIGMTVGQLWLDAYKAQESIVIIEKNRALFEQLIDLAESSYATGLSKNRQQNIIRAQLELTRLDDKLTLLRQRRDIFQEKLAEWLNDHFLDKYSPAPQKHAITPLPQYELVQKIPDISLLNPELYMETAEITPDRLYEKFSHHPLLKALDQKISASTAGIELAKQKYKPEWGINAGYGFRSRDPLGQNRSDLFSIGATFTIPLFTANRQDKEVQSARSRTAAVKTEKWQLLRKFMADFEVAKTELKRLNDRQKLYQNQLLPQMNEQTESSLSAYRNDGGGLAEVIRAYTAELDAKVIALEINVDRQKTILRLNYLFITNADEFIKNPNDRGDLK